MPILLAVPLLLAGPPREQIQRRFPEARVVKALNTMNAYLAGPINRAWERGRR